MLGKRAACCPPRRAGEGARILGTSPCLRSILRHACSVHSVTPLGKARASRAKHVCLGLRLWPQQLAPLGMVSGKPASPLGAHPGCTARVRPDSAGCRSMASHRSAGGATATVGQAFAT